MLVAAWQLCGSTTDVEKLPSAYLRYVPRYLVT